MKPTQQQDILLRQYLRDNLRYRETYEEVYDHVITALTYGERTGTLEEEVNRILREDFGGYNELRNMESKAKSVAISNGVSKYLHFYAGYFKLPNVLYTVGFAVLVYFTLAQIRLQPIVLAAMFGFIILVPAILSLRRYYIVGYLFRDKKRSIRDDIFARIAMVPNRLFVFCGIGLAIKMDKGKDIWHAANPMVLTILYIASAIYLLSLIKLYRDEFKMMSA